MIVLQIAFITVLLVCVCMSTYMLFNSPYTFNMGIFGAIVFFLVGIVLSPYWIYEMFDEKIRYKRLLKQFAEQDRKRLEEKDE